MKDTDVYNGAITLRNTTLMSLENTSDFEMPYSMQLMTRITIHTHLQIFPTVDLVYQQFRVTIIIFNTVRQLSSTVATENTYLLIVKPMNSVNHNKKIFVGRNFHSMTLTRV